LSVYELITNVAAHSVKVDIETYPGFPHGFYTIPILPVVPEYFKKTAVWIKELLATKGWNP
jgi:hypothetical protein